MSNLILVDNYLKIIQEIGRWKVISYKDLYKSLNQEGSYSMFTTRIKNLEERGLLNSLMGSNRRKYLYLTESGSKYSNTDTPLVEEITLNHDLITTNVINKLLEHDTFSSGSIALRETQDGLIPDGIVYGKKNDVDFTMAIEVELTQKSKKRVIEKICQYADSVSFEYCLYITNKESIFKSYKNIIKEMDHDVRKRIILLVDKSLDPNHFNYENALCLINGEEKIFKEIIG